ncbi:elafin [Orycteropus afer afer]|uniref:Elafin n=1 Tax=Orycteropus afer afer TaxID=1230840 RepID=A0A8B6ZNA6_ORYAF|nr:elafin [Orycteropus afer afer]
MKSSNLLALTVFLVLGTLVVEAAVVGVPGKGKQPVKGHALVKGQDLVKGQVPVKGQDPVRGQGLAKGPVLYKAGSCPKILIQCAMLNPPDRCWSDAGCPGTKKCCMGSCGRACLDPR